MTDASSFSYVSTMSTDLNLYCEPPPFLRPEERAPFEPVAFFGSLWPDDPGYAGSRAALSPFGQAAAGGLRVYASFGTVVWRYYEAAAIGSLDALADACADRPDVSALISLGGMGRPALAARLTRPNVRVEPYVDQWRVLSEASVCVTHQGLNSTHEAIFHRVPMLSYPFFWDQPALAARCADLGLAVPLAGAPRGPVTADMIASAFDRVERGRDEMSARLAEARRWELDTIAQRPAVVRRILGLVR